MTEEQIVNVAMICHEANKAYCRTLGDYSQVAWLTSPLWQRDSAIAGVRACMENPDAPPSASHEAWVDRKTKEGWTYGKEKHAILKQHPCVLPYDELPPEQQKKDRLFCAICKALITD